MVAAAVIGTVAAAGIGAAASSNAAGDQESAAKNAQAIAQNQYQNNVGLEQPYNAAGLNATNQLQYLEGLSGGAPGQAQSSAPGGYGSLNAPFTAQTFQQMSPAYQFQLQQGQQGVRNQETGTGALSGSALKDLTSYNQGMANTSFNTAFQQYQEQNTNTYNRLANIANLGQSAASMTAQTGTSLAGTAAQAATNYGTAAAGGAVGVGNALSGGASNAGALWSMYGGGGQTPPPSTSGSYNFSAPSGGNWDGSNPNG